jgi:choline dehydrogenase-like flavoprotein
MPRVIVDLGADAPDPAGALPDYDLCIVGTGPAGATVAAELRGSGLSICLLESGRKKPTPRGDRLRAVRSEGLFIKEYSRERVLGGTSTTWAGLSAPLEPIELAPRPWVPRSGWPFGRAELDRFYARAARYRFPRLADFGPEGFGALRARSQLAPGWAALAEKVFLAAQPPQDFAREQRDLLESDAVTVYLDATVVALDAAGGRVRAARVRTSRGAEREVRARAFVLATGGIENARLLLISGLGNERDQVGRGFMNHPKSYAGVLRLARPVTDAAYFFGCLFRGFAGYGGLRLPDATQRELGLLSSYVRLEPLFPWTDDPGVEALIALVQRSKLVMNSVRRRGETEVVQLRDYAETGDDSDVKNARKSALDWLVLVAKIVAHAPRVAQYLWYRLVPGRVPRIRAARLRNFMEMEPDPENRVVLCAERDEDGKPLPLVRSRCTALDRRSMVAVHAALRAEVARLGLGVLESELTADDPWPIDQDASHHLGTTRMGVDPAESVVDPDLRVHGVANLYCAGGSVFPTSGCANPTFTIVALSARLADHLQRVLGAGEGGA